MNCIALLIFAFTCVLFYVAPPTVVASTKSYIRLFVINYCLCLPKIIRFSQSVWKVQTKMWVGHPHGIQCFQYGPIWTDFNKIVRHVLEETLNKTMQKCPLYLLYVLALPWEIWNDWLSCTYMYILMNQLMARNTTSSHCVKCVVSYIIFTLRAQNVRS